MNAETSASCGHPVASDEGPTEFCHSQCRSATSVGEISERDSLLEGVTKSAPWCFLNLLGSGCRRHGS